MHGLLAFHGRSDPSHLSDEEPELRAGLHSSRGRARAAMGPCPQGLAVHWGWQ